jgi:hypothetical protein
MSLADHYAAGRHPERRKSMQDPVTAILNDY